MFICKTNQLFKRVTVQNCLVKLPPGLLIFVVQGDSVVGAVRNGHAAVTAELARNFGAGKRTARKVATVSPVSCPSN